MTNKEKIDRIKQIELDQLPLIKSLDILDNSVRTLSHKSDEYLIAKEIYDQHSIEMKALVIEKISLLISLGFNPKDGMIDESLRNTDLWKQIESEETAPEISNSRFLICTNCPEFVTISSQCKKLGVFAEEYSKLDSSSCPIGMW